MMWAKKQIEDLNKQLALIIADRDIYKSRCKDLEDAMEKEYGIKVRTEITEMKTIFDKEELTILYAALCKLMEGKHDTNTIQYYLTLRIKIEKTLAEMKE